MEIYYESDPIMGVNFQYKDKDGVFHHDYVQSFYIFKIFVNSEFYKPQIIEITNTNYAFLLEQGKIDG